jgi:hypothetical protein
VGSRLGVEPQLGLARPRIGAVAGEAAIGEQRADVAVVAERIGPCADCRACREDAGKGCETADQIPSLQLRHQFHIP